MTASYRTPKTPTVWHGDGRELAVLNHILSLPNLNEIRGKPQAILEEIEKWSERNQILMIIGPERGSTIMDLISETKPKTMVEFGGYIGYSAIKFGSAVKAVGGQRYLSFESNAETKYRFDTEPCKPEAAPREIDILFLDHAENLYLTDLKLCEDLHLLHTGSYVVADNVGSPETGEYVSWVEGKIVVTPWIYN
ncbi:hypothetical protein F5Y08DRAFT_345904 [Xylaria arbuscula]|nr:hypothetical protein F5Y08DRAFT_345904 [Xylaria arbuscula]